MSLSTHVTDGTMTIRIRDRFDFKIHGDLRRAYEEQPCERYVVDLSETEYMDSAALGMLLQLREFAGGRPDSVVIRNAAPTIRKVLEVANFDRLMQIH